MNTVLAVADPHPAHHFLVRCGARLARQGWRLRTVPYSRIRDVPTDGVRAAILFFPHAVWAEIEAASSRLYGSVAHGAALREYLTGAGDVLRLRVPDIGFLNSPEAIGLTRDKGAVKARWTEAGVPTPAPVAAASGAELAAAVTEHGCVYVKAPCGSMNKGITMLTPDRFRSNLVFADGALRAPRAGDPQYVGDDQWEFVDVDGADPRFLAALCAEPGMVVERGLAGAAIDGARIEARVTVLGGQVVSVAVASAPSGEPATGPQAGAAPPRLPPAVTTRIERLALQAAAALDLCYAVLDVVLDTDLTPMVIDAQAFPATRTPLSLFEAMLGHLIDENGGHAPVPAGPRAPGRSRPAPPPGDVS